MPIYNLYFMSDRGHIDRIAHIEAASDDVAIGLILEDQGRQPIEVWSNHRKVYRAEAVTGNGMRRRQVHAA